MPGTAAGHLFERSAGNVVYGLVARLRFMFCAGLIVLPLILSDTVTVYRVFRGKIVEDLRSH
jgi:hypothetical protein